MGHLPTSVKISPEKYATIVFCCFQSLTCNRKTFFPFFEEFFFSELTHLHFKNHLFEYCKLRASLYQKALFLSQLNNFLCSVRSRAVFDKSTDPGNDWMVAQIICFSLSCTPNFPRNFDRNGHQNNLDAHNNFIINVIVKTNWEHGLFSYGP